MNNIWQKGNANPDNWMLHYTVGEDPIWDMYLFPYDIIGTQGHAWGLKQIGILTKDEYHAIKKALKDIEKAYQKGAIQILPEDEDMHTVIERMLTEKLGDLGKKIHTGRSRNDQVVTALRLFLKDALKELAKTVQRIGLALCDFATQHKDSLLPGYTHLQQAMPSSFALWSLGYAELLLSDLSSIKHGFEQVDCSPLGSAAGYGVPLIKLERKAVAKKLGFSRLQESVTSVQLSRGKIELAVVQGILQVGATLNRLASDLVMFNMQEFDFIRLPEAFCTGSSIMPQKKNPDILEITRAKYHQLLGEQQTLQSIVANMPSGYHRDLQLTKGCVLKSVLILKEMLHAMERLLPKLNVNIEKLATALTPALFATGYALEKVLQGNSFRDAYRESASELHAVQVPDTEAILATYQSYGTLGNLPLESIKEKLISFEIF